VFKAVILLARAEGATHEEFRRWWLGEHAELARGLPGLRRLVFNVVEPGEAPYDGVSELWFDSREAFESAYASDHGRAVAADSLANVGGRLRLLVEEHALVE
jgi:uncharacterized protein (TIGR02118 family)